jgi:iron complex transport system ATP-binding protein
MNLVEASNVTFGYRGAPVLRDVGFAIGAGELVGLCGPNGAGKSTLLRLLLGPARAVVGARDAGRTPLAGLSRRQIARHAALLPQDAPADVPLSVREAVALGRLPHLGRLQAETAADVEAVTRALAATDTTALAERPLTELSGGERHRVHLARALAQEAPLLLLDEPIAGLDIAHQLAAMDLLRATVDAGRAVVVALHDLALAARPLRSHPAARGRRAGRRRAPADVLTRETLARVFGVRADVRLDPAGRPSSTSSKRSKAVMMRPLTLTLTLTFAWACTFTGRHRRTPRSRRKPPNQPILTEGAPPRPARLNRPAVGSRAARRPAPPRRWSRAAREPPPPRADQAAAASVVSSDESPRAYDDLASLLARVPGVNVVRTGSLGKSSTITLRGSNPDQVRVYVDGVPVNIAAGGGVDISTLPIGDVERVEVYRGSSPLRFGESALGASSRSRRARPARRGPRAHRHRIVRDDVRRRQRRRRVGRLRLYVGAARLLRAGRLSLPQRQRHRLQSGRRHDDAAPEQRRAAGRRRVRGRAHAVGAPACSAGADRVRARRRATGHGRVPDHARRFRTLRGFGYLRYESRDDLGRAAGCRRSCSRPCSATGWTTRPTRRAWAGRR